MGANKMASLVYLAMFLLVATNESQALTCGEVVSKMIPCLNYLKNGGAPTAVCCSGTQTVYNTANTTPLRRVACACIKEAAKSFAINYGYANGLPPKCGVHVNYQLSPSLDCGSIN